MTQITDIHPTVLADSADDTANVLSLLSNIAENTQKQADAAKRQLFLTKILLAAVLLILIVAVVSVAILVPKTVTMLDNLNSISEQLTQLDINTISTELIEMAESIEDITAQLAPTLGNINDAVLSAQEDITVALENLKSLDLETLNTAIKDLSSVIKPLASLFRR